MPSSSWSIRLTEPSKQDGEEGVAPPGAKTLWESDGEIVVDLKHGRLNPCDSTESTANPFCESERSHVLFSQGC